MASRTHFLLLLLCAIAVDRCRSQDATSAKLLEPTIREKTPFAYEAFVHVLTPVVAPGGILIIRCEARGNADASHLYNPFLSERYRLPARVVITSRNGNMHYNVLRNLGTRTEKTDSCCWATLGGCFVGRELRIRVAKPDAADRPDPRTLTANLPPGEYYVQAVYNHWLIAHWPNAPESVESVALNQSADAPLPHAGWSPSQMEQSLAISAPGKFVVSGAPTIHSEPAPATELGMRIELGQPRLHRESPDPGVQTCEVAVRFTNEADGSQWVFNPRLDDRLFWNKHAADLAVYTHDDAYIANALNSRFGRNKTPTRIDWIRVPPGGTFSSMCRFSTGHLISDGAAGPELRLPSGRFALKLSARQSMFAFPPTVVEQTSDIAKLHADPAYRLWLGKFPGPIVNTSNRVEFDLPGSK